MGSGEELFDCYDYQELQKRIRNKARKYKPDQVLTYCFDYLYQPSKTKIDKIGRQPWLVMLLVKWVLLDEQYDLPGKKNLTRNAFNDIMQSMIGLGSKIRMPSDYSHHILFFRNIAYQQFLYQIDLDTNRLARQFILFCDGPDSQFYKTEFLKTDLPLDTFLELSFILLCRYIPKDNSSGWVSYDWFDEVIGQYSKEQINTLMKLLSKTLIEARSFLLENKNWHDLSEFYEQSPFLSFPFISSEMGYFCVSPNLLFRAIEDYVYDKLRSYDAQKFMAKFGKTFEAYVKKGLDYSEVPYVAESELKRILEGTGQVVDFFVHDNGTNILIDAKAVEMPDSGKVTHLSEVVEGRVKNSIIKAIEQAFDVLKRLEVTINANSIAQVRDDNYLLVVTYKELFVGNGKFLHEAIAKDKIDQLYCKYAGSRVIPLENMYFITIDDFDHLVELSRTGQLSFAKALSLAKESDRETSTMKFNFHLHLRSWGNLKPPSYLKERIDKLFQSVENAFK